MRNLPLIIALCLLAACGSQERPSVSDMDAATPTMTTTDVHSFISDSGYTRYRMDAPLWLVYDDSDDPRWRFPQGLAIEQYDRNLATAANVDCDSATYFSRRRLWRLDGNVVMVNSEGDSFLTQQLFWDQSTRKIRSDSFIHIVRTDRIIEGIGFESDENMRSYMVLHPTAILPSDQFKK